MNASSAICHHPDAITFFLRASVEHQKVVGKRSRESLAGRHWLATAGGVRHGGALHHYGRGQLRSTRKLLRRGRRLICTAGRRCSRSLRAIIIETSSSSRLRYTYAPAHGVNKIHYGRQMPGTRLSAERSLRDPQVTVVGRRQLWNRSFCTC